MKNISYRLATIIAISLTSIILQSCSSNDTKKEAVVRREGVKFIFPDSLIAYRPFGIENFAGRQDFEANTLRIVTFIDVSCPSCLSEIKNWEKVEQKLKKYNVPIIVICQSEDKFETFKFLCEQKKIPELKLPFYLDLKNAFFEKNSSLSAAKNQHTVLIDQNNNMLILGDFTFSKTIENAYIEELNTHNHTLKRNEQN
ncbi:redoxin family protein [Pedobacter sp.]